MMQMVGVFAEFERSLIRERSAAGLAQARAEGRIGGRPRKLNDNQAREIVRMVKRATSRRLRLRGFLRCIPLLYAG